MRTFVNYLILLAVKYVSKLFFRHEWRFVGKVPERPWESLRIVAILNHTSLYEPVFAGIPPNRFFRELARHGIVPIAEKTYRRPIVGRFFSVLAPHVIPLSRKRDETWRQVLDRIDDTAGMVAILPEGRMKRRNGLDAHGNPLRVRSGIADLLEAIPSGRMLIAYSGGLHHVQAPGELIPRLFKTVRLNVEVVDIGAYREARRAETGPDGFRQAVIADLERRRDLYCPTADAPALPRSER